jgi:hypothetical protein
VPYNKWIGTADGLVTRTRVTGEVELVAQICGRPDILKVSILDFEHPCLAFSIEPLAEVFCDGNRVQIGDLFKWLAKYDRRASVTLYPPDGPGSVSVYTEFKTLN